MVPVRHRGELLGALSLVEAARRGAHPDRTNARRGSRRAGRAGAAQRGAHRRAGSPTGGASGVPAAPGERPGRGAPPSGAQHPRRRTAAARGHRGPAGARRTARRPRRAEGEGAPRGSSASTPRRPSTTCATWPGGSTRRCSRTRAWPSPSSPRPERRPSPSRSPPTARAAIPRRSRRPCTSRVSRPSRTRRSTPTPRASTSGCRTRTRRCRSRSRTTAMASTRLPVRLAPGLTNMRDRLDALGRVARRAVRAGRRHHRRRADPAVGRPGPRPPWQVGVSSNARPCACETVRSSGVGCAPTSGRSSRREPMMPRRERRDPR